MAKTCAYSNLLTRPSNTISSSLFIDSLSRSVSPLASSRRQLYKFSSCFFFCCSSFNFFQWSSREISEQAQQLPCPFQTLRHIQQNQYLHRHVMCMQPLFFYIIQRHMGHFCTTRPFIHWSSLPLTSDDQLRRSRHQSGQWASLPQCRQTSVPHQQPRIESIMVQGFMKKALPQIQLGQRRACRLCWLYFKQSRRQNWPLRVGSLCHRASMRWKLVRWQHSSCGQRGKSSQILRSVQFSPRRVCQQSPQKAWPQGLASNSFSTRHTSHSPWVLPGALYS